MNRQFRNRVFLPIAMPVGVVLAIGGVVAGFAFILLYNTRVTAVIVAILMAGGVLVAVSLAASRDSLDRPRKAAVLAAGGTPVVLGALLAFGVIGGLPTDELNINREPHFVVPSGAPVIAAENAQSFCDPQDGCPPASQVQLPAGQETTLVFDNQDDVVHNWTMRPNEESSEVIAATADGLGQLTATIPAQEPGDYFFICTIHPVMTGTVTVSEDITQASVGGSSGGGSGETGGSSAGGSGGSSGGESG